MSCFVFQHVTIAGSNAQKAYTISRRENGCPVLVIASSTLSSYPARQPFTDETVEKSDSVEQHVSLKHVKESAHF